MTSPSPACLNAAHFLLDKHLEQGHGDRIAILEVGRGELTYRQLQQAANRLARRFAAAGVARGERVCLLLPDGQDLVAAFLGCLKLGAVAVPLNSFAPANQLAFFLQDTVARLLVTHSSYRELAEQASQEVRTSPATIFLDSDRWQELPGEWENAATGADDDAFWLYTSGSTGNPKAVVHRHGAIPPCAAGYGQEVLRIVAADRVFSTSKLFFAYGLGNSLLFPLSVGASAVLQGGRSTEEVICDVVRHYRPTLFFAVPTLYSRLLRRGIERQLFAEVRMCISAGEALPLAVEERWKEATGHTIYDGIGTTETMHIFCSNRLGDVQPGTIGRPVGGYELAILDDEGKPVEPGQTGYLHVCGASLAKGYWHRPDATIRVFPDGWLRTGDVFRQQDGYYHFSGRSDDCFKSSGLWVSPIAIEGVLLAQPGVMEAAVIAAPDAEGLLGPKAFVVVSPDASDGAASLSVVHARLTASFQHLPKHMRPHTIEFVAQLPRTATGKIARQLLRSPG